MDKLEMYVGGTNITQYVADSIVNSGEYRSCCRTLDFSVLNNKVNIKVGNIVSLKVNNKLQFRGIITSKSTSTDANTTQLSSKDHGIYLKRNSATYKFKNASPKSITERICRDFGIPYSWAYNLGTKVTRNFINCNLYEIIMTAYTLNSDKKFCIQFIDGKLVVLERGAIAVQHIIDSNLISLNATENIDNMVNTVNVYNADDKLIKTIKNDSDRKLYGQFNDYIKLSKDDKTNYVENARKKLQELEQKISVGCIGNSSFTTGKALLLEVPNLAYKGKFFIDEDVHTWQNGIYTNKLTLNFKSIMDENEAGEVEANKVTGKLKKGKKGKKKKDYSSEFKKYTDRLKS